MINKLKNRIARQHLTSTRQQRAFAEALEGRRLLSLSAAIEVLTGTSSPDPYQSASSLSNAITIKAGQTLHLDAVGDYFQPVSGQPAGTFVNSSTYNNSQ